MIIKINLFVALKSIVCCCLQVFAVCLQFYVCCFIIKSLQAFSNFNLQKTLMPYSFPVCCPLRGERVNLQTGFTPSAVGHLRVVGMRKMRTSEREQNELA